MSNRKALCVGINVFKNYPGSNLHGCVNDAHDMAGVLTQVLGFTTPDIKLLTDADATKTNIMGELASMVADAKAGKFNHLVFSQSSHGTQVPDKNGDESDHYDEAFCPHDLAEVNGKWDPKHVIVDDELHDLFAQVPSNVLIEVYLDTCHSGTGLRALDLRPDQRPRYLTPPSREAYAEVEHSVPRGTVRNMADRDVAHAVLFAACRASQTSADAYIGGKYHGAFTYYFCKEVLQSKGISRAELRKRVNVNLKGGGYSQVSQLECTAAQRKRPIGLA